MRMKRQNGGDFPTDMRIFDRPLQQCPMSEMDTVKIPNCQMNRLHGLKPIPLSFMVEECTDFGKAEGQYDG
jgi:hypothetical protein